MRSARLDEALLYFVCEARPGGANPGPLLDAALRGGVDIVQMREKAEQSDEQLIELAAPFRRAAAEHGALFILNDRPDLVAACGADGAHVGQDDAPVTEARQSAGPGALIGLSTHSVEQIEAAADAADEARPDQISVGPVWETPTKPGRAATGLNLVELADRRLSVPWFAIGGIDEASIGAVVGAGGRRAVVVRAIRDAADPERTAAALRRALGGDAQPRQPAGDVPAERDG
ncbi:MAG: thiamine phosphate synthase [Solirubrobacterales bacterium]